MIKLKQEEEHSRKQYEKLVNGEFSLMKDEIKNLKIANENLIKERDQINNKNKKNQK